MPDRPMGQIRRLRLELANRESLLALHAGGLREALKILYAANGGCVAKAIAELERFVPEAERQKPQRKPCP